MLLSDFIRGAERDLSGLYPEREARSIVRLLCSEELGTKSYTHILDPSYSIEGKVLEKLEAAMVRLCAGEPVQHVVGSTEFFGLKFRVTPDVLIPRPETEQLVREAVKEASRLQGLRLSKGSDPSPVRVLDLCTGSGCIAWSVAVSVPGVEVVAVDNSEPALETARSQYFGHEVMERGVIAPEFVLADVLEEGEGFDHGFFDLIVSNPPYVMESEKAFMRSNVLDYEPARALFVPDDDPLLFYRAIAQWSLRFLSEEGKGMTEINENLGGATEAVFKEAGFTETEQKRDVFDRIRFVAYAKKRL